MDYIELHVHVDGDRNQALCQIVRTRELDSMRCTVYIYGRAMIGSGEVLSLGKGGGGGEYTDCGPPTPSIHTLPFCQNLLCP